MKIFVTGAAGFIGFHVVNALLQNGDEVVGLDNINDYYDVNLKYARLAEAGVRREFVKDDCIVTSESFASYRFVKSDIVNLSFLESLFETERFDKVIHLAAQAGVRYSIENPHVYIQSNIVGFVNILECCRHFKVQHLVYASSSSVYGANQKVPFSEEDSVDKPISLYAATKKSNELMAYTYSHLYRLPTTGLRFFTVYGPWGRPDMAPILFAEAISKGRPIQVFNNGDMERDFTFIDDIVAGVIGIVDSRFSREFAESYSKIYNIGNSKPIKLLDFISELENALGKSAVLKMLPMQPGDVKRTYADISSLTQEINYSPACDLSYGVAEFSKWYKSFFYGSL